MQIYFAQNLKKLRRERELTQEDLARFLNVSFQAVSKWERGETSPDIEMLPAIARYFAVTTDALLGVDKLDEDAAMEEYHAKSMVLANQGKIHEKLALWREAYSEFPNNHGAINQLMYSLYTLFQHTDDRAFADELIPLANILLTEKQNDNVTYSYHDFAIKMLCLTYLQLKDEENAKKYAVMAHSSLMNDTREMLLQRIKKGDELVEYAQGNIANYLDSIDGSVHWIAANKDDDNEYRIHAFEVLAKLYETVFEDGDFGFYHIRMEDIYKTLTKWYAEANNAAEVIRCAKIARRHARAWDSAVTHTLTAPLMNMQLFDVTGFSTTEPNPRNRDTAEFLEGEVYSFLRDNAEFQALLY